MHTTMIPGKLYRLSLEELPFWKSPDNHDAGVLFKRGTVFMFIEIVNRDSKSEVSRRWYKFIAPSGEVLGRYLSVFTGPWLEPVVVASR